MNGIVVINKPKGFTSMDCCAIIRKLAKEKRVGHTGTLDPNATGVLPICIGKATRLIEYMDAESKTYIGGFRLGYTSDTEDVWGEIEGSGLQNPVCREALENALKSFIGDIEQVPPMYSAKKINGQKLYDLARQGKEIERKANKIHIFGIKILEFDGFEGLLEIECSRGTYIRTIMADLGKALGCGAIMSSLVRSSCCGFSLDQAVDLEVLREAGEVDAKYILPVDKALSKMPSITAEGKLAKYIENGNPEFEKFLPDISNLGDNVAVRSPQGRLIAILEKGKIDKVFH